MIFTFSGTGNSRYVAGRLAEELEDGLVSINRCLKTGCRGPFQSERPLVFVAPTYCWRMPALVEDWVRQTEFQGCRQAYFVLTCAGGCGNAGAYARRLCAEKGLRFGGLAPVVMPENYLALFPTPGPAECEAIVRSAGPEVSALAGRIRAGERLAPPSVTLAGRLESGPVNPLFYALFVRDRKFRITDRCVSCGQCARRCPLGNISLTDGRPLWMGRCTHCMACIAGCPARCIEYGAKTAGRHRHYLQDDPAPLDREESPS